MSNFWKKLNQESIKERVYAALEQNVNYADQIVLGVPASYLDEKVFYRDAMIVKEAPFISTLIQNPNHIGCHTLGQSERFFAGTQAIELDLLNICAVDILKAETGSFDGYVAAGGTEANMQALWVYRNYYKKEYSALPSEITLMCSEDSHYSMDKAADVLSIDLLKIPVGAYDRKVSKRELQKCITGAQDKGKKYFIVVCNMMTTMFGSVDDPTLYAEVLREQNCQFKMHVDGAYGGFYFPFSNAQSKLDFTNPHITSFTLDAHKMAQAPYGTGIFLIRKNYIQFANTRTASYVEGEDYTLIGSRSGANAVAVWMILSKNGPYGWFEKIFVLQKRTEWMCRQLDELGVRYYRHPYSNIITIAAESVPESVAKEFGLIPDNHANPKWFKIVLMDHVTIEKLIPLVQRLSN